METIPDFDELISRAKELPNLNPKFAKNYLYFQGYLNPRFSYGSNVPEEVHQTTRKIEKIIDEEFALRVVGFETTIPIPEKPRGNISRYLGLIKAISEAGSDAVITFTAYHVAYSNDTGGGYFEANLQIESYLPTNGHIESTKRSLDKIWPLIKGFEFSSPEIPEGAKKVNFQPGSIVLVRNGVAIATGHACFKELNLKLPEKDILLISGNEV